MRHIIGGRNVFVVICWFMNHISQLLSHVLYNCVLPFPKSFIIATILKENRVILLIFNQLLALQQKLLLFHFNFSIFSHVKQGLFTFDEKASM